MEFSHSTAVISEPGCGLAKVRKLAVKTQDLVVENYSSIVIPFKSEDIVCGGHRWAVLFATERPPDIAEQGFTCVYLVRMSDATHTLQYTIQIDLLDQSPTGNQNFSVPELSDRQVRCLPAVQPAGFALRFIRRSLLESPDSRYLRNDSLKFRVRIGVFSYHEAEAEAESELVFIRVANQTFCATKCALAHRCPKLLSYDHHGRLQDIVVSDAVIQPHIFKVALGFITTGSVAIPAVDDFDPPVIVDPAKLLAATSMLELKPFKSMCELHLSNKICRESVASLLHLAHLCNASHLKSKCLRFVAQDPSIMIKCDEFQLLKEKCPVLVQELFLEIGIGLGNRDNNEKEKQDLSLELAQGLGYGDNNPQRFTNLKNEVLNMYKTIEFKVSRYWPRFSANKIKTL